MVEKHPSAEMYIINAPLGGSSLNPATMQKQKRGAMLLLQITREKSTNTEWEVNIVLNNNYSYFPLCS